MGKQYKKADSQFFCVKCKNEGIPIFRRKGQEREAGHLKKLFCIHCHQEVNHVEVKSNYTYEDFLLEFYGNNFDNEGNRKEPFNIFKHNLTNEEIFDIVNNEGEDNYDEE